jgi:hypothetical protein
MVGDESSWRGRIVRVTMVVGEVLFDMWSLSLAVN